MPCTSRCQARAFHRLTSASEAVGAHEVHLSLSRSAAVAFCGSAASTGAGPGAPVHVRGREWLERRGCAGARGERCGVWTAQSRGRRWSLHRSRHFLSLICSAAARAAATRRNGRNTSGLGANDSVAVVHPPAAGRRAQPRVERRHARRGAHKREPGGQPHVVRLRVIDVTDAARRASSCLLASGMQVSSLLTCRCVGSARVRARRVCASPGLPGHPQCLRALTTQPRRACLARVGGGDEGGGVVEGARKAWRTAEPLVETLAEALPSSVPLVGRKAGVVLIGGGLSFWALKSLLNTAFTLVVRASFARPPRRAESATHSSCCCSPSWRGQSPKAQTEKRASAAQAGLRLQRRRRTGTRRTLWRRRAGS